MLSPSIEISTLYRAITSANVYSSRHEIFSVTFLATTSLSAANFFRPNSRTAAARSEKLPRRAQREKPSRRCQRKEEKRLGRKNSAAKSETRSDIEQTVVFIAVVLVLLVVVGREKLCSRVENAETCLIIYRTHTRGFRSRQMATAVAAICVSASTTSVN